jgi:hypothetical protein
MNGIFGQLTTDDTSTDDGGLGPAIPGATASGEGTAPGLPPLTSISPVTPQVMQPSVGPALQQVQAALPALAPMPGMPAPMPSTPPKKSIWPWIFGIGAVAAIGGLAYYYTKKDKGVEAVANPRRKKAESSRGGAGKRCPVGTEVQTLIFDADDFDRREAVAWAKRGGFSASKVDETGSSYRIRQHSPGQYRKGSFRTISLDDGVKAVIGCPR